MKHITKYLKIWMLPIVVTALCLTLTSCSNAQVDELPRTIEVTGSAEMQVEPDVVKLEVVITEDYHKNKKDEFLKILKENGVSKDKIAFQSQYDNNWWYYYHYHNYQEVKYMITIDSTVNAMQLMKDLKEPWVRRINISEKSNSKIQQYRKDVKIEAIKAAREKAEYMLAALGEELGAVISVEEVNTDHNQVTPNYWWASNNNSNAMVSNSVVNTPSTNSQSSVQGVSMQKLRYEVKITFYIKEQN